MGWCGFWGRHDRRLAPCGMAQWERDRGLDSIRDVSSCSYKRNKYGLTVSMLNKLVIIYSRRKLSGSLYLQAVHPDFAIGSMTVQL